MNIQLIEGEFSPGDTLELMTQFIHVKIKYHENKIAGTENEEDIKARESKIKLLQKELYDLRATVNSSDKNFKIDGALKVD